jgi:UDP-N-acetylmuramoylalanine--D-glutamate ligase
VVEVSSFQLETVHRFRPHVGVLLNCFPNHLERHGSLAAYLGVKARLFARALESDVCIVPGALLEEVRTRTQGRSRWRTFGVSERDDYCYRAGRVERAGATLVSLEGTRFANDVFGASAAAGVAAVEAAGVSLEHAVQAARNFQPLPHRLERLATVRGITFVNDSKATNLAAMTAALRAIPGRVRLLAGGLAKESDFSSVKEVLAEKVAGVYLMGKSADVMFKAWSEAVSCVVCGTLPEAFGRACKDASAGETVLLSPGCASFDQFRNFEERGDLFREHVARRAASEGKRTGIP